MKAKSKGIPIKGGFARHYDRYNKWGGFGEGFREQIADEADLQPGDSVLDCGCGTGTLAVIAKRRTGADGEVCGIDLSTDQLDIARKKAGKEGLDINFFEGSIDELPFPDNSFDQVFTSCTLCSVPDPIKGLRALKRVLKPTGELKMFEHTGSRYFPFNLSLHFMTLLTRMVGPDMNRNTVDNVQKAGFIIKELNNLYMDIVKTIYAFLPGSNNNN